MTDTIADFLTRIRNAVAANHRIVEVPASNVKKEITKILFTKGYILSYKFDDESRIQQRPSSCAQRLRHSHSFHLKRYYDR